MINKRDSELIKKIAIRAVEMSAAYGMGKWEIGDAIMDITCAHEDCGLRLKDLLAADDFNFAHDVFGINRHLDHKIMKLTKCFTPRFAA